MSLWNGSAPTPPLLEVTDRNHNTAFNSRGKGGICRKGQHALRLLNKMKYFAASILIETELMNPPCANAY